MEAGISLVTTEYSTQFISSPEETLQGKRVTENIKDFFRISHMLFERKL